MTDQTAPIPPLNVTDLDGDWDFRADVVVVGLGGAGLSAAIEAAERGASVIALDRSAGGGTTSMAGGILYLGGGTATQIGAGIDDTVEEMRAFLSDALGRPLDDPRLVAYCTNSVAHHDWLVDHGVPFEPKFWPEPGMEPPGTEGLIYSGGEDAAPYRERHRPVARGHVPATPNAAGGFLAERLRTALEATNARILVDHRAERLVVDDDRVVGVTVKADGNTLSIAADRGVILACGGWAYNDDLLKRYAPELLNVFWRLGTDADDGWALRVTTALGAAVEGMHTLEVAVPITPPRDMVRGVIVNAAGERFINEDTYFGHVGQSILTEQDGVAWYLVDEPRYLVNRVGMRAENVCETWEELAEEIGLPADKLAATMAAYNEAAAKGEDPTHGKASEWVVPLDQPPFGAIDLRVGKAVFAGFPLGGAVIDEHGRVVRTDGTTVAGLYAVGRAASSLALQRYCSGISIGEGTFFGRRAAAHALGA